MNDFVEIGNLLREKRIDKNLTINEVSEIIRIKPEHISALENGTAKDSLFPVYSLGFLKTYSRYLGLNSEELIEQFKELCGEEEEITAPLNLVSEPYSDNFKPTKIILFISLVLILVIYVLWYKYHNFVNNQPINVIESMSSVFSIESHKEKTPEIQVNLQKIVLLAKSPTSVKIKDKLTGEIHEITMSSGDTYFIPDNMNNIEIIPETESKLEIFVDGKTGSLEMLKSLGKNKEEITLINN